MEKRVVTAPYGRRGLKGDVGPDGVPGDTNPPAPTTDILKAAHYLAAVKVTTGDSLVSTSLDVRYHVELPDFPNTAANQFLLEIFGGTLETATTHGFIIDCVFGGYDFNGTLTRIKTYDRAGELRPMGVYIHSTTGNLVIWFDAGNYYTTFRVDGKRVGNGTTVGQAMNGIVHVTETGIEL